MDQLLGKNFIFKVIAVALVTGALKLLGVNFIIRFLWAITVAVAYDILVNGPDPEDD